MKRSLLLLPFLAMFLMACPEKHTTSSATPPMPDPNAYNTAPPVQPATGTISEPSSDYGSTVYGDVANNATTTYADSVAAADSVKHVVGKPNAHPDTTRLVVNFISKGAGIDQAAKTNLDKYLSKHPDVKYTAMQKGREGEWQYCFVMKDQASRNQLIQISEIKAAIGTNDRVFYSENVVCDHVHELAIATPQVVDGNAIPESRPADTTRLVVNFISKGQGIDQDAKLNLDKYLSKHPDIKFYETQRGRENERQYCFMLNDRKAASQVNVVNDIRGIIGTNDRVFITENVVCTHSHGKDAEPEEIIAPTVNVSSPDTTSNTARLVVSFTSKGSGIDLATQADFEKWLGERNAVWETTHFGREGEINYCFRLENKDARQQEIFVRDVRTFMTGKETVFVEEYAPCDKRK